MRILKYLFISVFLFFEISNIVAGDFKGGLLAGFCASQMDGDKLAGYNKFGPTAGFFIQRDFIKNWGGQFEMRYDQKGAASVKDEQSYKVRLNYIELPVMATYKIIKKVRAEAGIEPSILFSSKVLLNQTVSNPKYNTFDLPLAIGGYYSINKSMEINIRFSYSLLPVRGNITPQNVAYYGYNTFNNAFNFVFYYYLR